MQKDVSELFTKVLLNSKLTNIYIKAQRLSGTAAQWLSGSAAQWH
jgi:hypothetical protein